MAGSLTSEQAKELAVKGVVARKKKSVLERHVGSSKRRKQLENAVWWAATHEEKARPPSELAKTMQGLRVQEPLKFNQVLLQVLPAPPKELPMPAPKEEDREKEVLGNAGKLLDDWMAERNKEEREKRRAKRIEAGKHVPGCLCDLCMDVSKMNTPEGLAEDDRLSLVCPERLG
jgi:hypothetical protein